MTTLLALYAWARTHSTALWVIAGVVLVVGSLQVAYLRGRSDEAAKAEARRRIEVAEALRSTSRADAVAVDTVMAKAEARSRLKEELTDAVAQVPDDVPDPVAVRLGCERLRNVGRRIADIPACRTFIAPAKAGAH